MCEFSTLNKKIRSLSENLEKAVNNMKVQNRNVNLLHEIINSLQNELTRKNEVVKSLTEIQLTVFDSLSATRNGPPISDLHHKRQ